jgi:hypothetical protein
MPVLNGFPCLQGYAAFHSGLLLNEDLAEKFYYRIRIRIVCKQQQFNAA